MEYIDWNKVKYFSPDENWGDVNKVKPELIYKLDTMRDYIGKPIIVHNAFATSGHSYKSYHYLGMAVDCHIKGLNVIEQYLYAERFGWGGIGVYINVWEGLHLDIRPYSSRWACRRLNKKGENDYEALDYNFIKYAIDKIE